MTTDTATLIAALRALAMITADNHSANAAIAEAADRLELQAKRNATLQAALEAILKHQRVIGGGFNGYSTTMLIAERALNYE